MAQRRTALAAFLLATACGIDGNGSFEESESALEAPRPTQGDDLCGSAGGVCLPAAELGEPTCPEGLEARGEIACGRTSVCCAYVGDPEPPVLTRCAREPSVDYLGESPEVCDAIDFLCPEGRAYKGPCGCGCLGG